MKTHRKMRRRPLCKAALLLLALACSPGVGAQFSNNSIDCNHSVVGDRTLIRMDHSREYIVTCSHTENDCSKFSVSTTDITKHFTTTNYIPNPHFSPYAPLNQGYVVKDMRIVGTTCWFVGVHWWETGNVVYGFGFGSPGEWEVKYGGFVGRFDVRDVVNGSGQYEILTIPGTRELTRLAAYSGGITAVGKNMFGVSKLVELEYYSSGQSRFSVGQSSYAEEVFMDVVNASGRIVVLSRFNNPSHYMYYRHYFGLRYGNIGNFFNTHNNNLYCYDNYYPFPDASASFAGLDPIFLNYTNSGNEVLVSYLGTTGPLNGELIMYRIPSEGVRPAEVQYSAGGYTYSAIRDVQFCHRTGFPPLPHGHPHGAQPTVPLHRLVRHLPFL